MNSKPPLPSLTTREIVAGWGRILRGNIPMLSIEITRECPLVALAVTPMGRSIWVVRSRFAT